MNCEQVYEPLYEVVDEKTLWKNSMKSTTTVECIANLKQMIGLVTGLLLTEYWPLVCSLLSAGIVCIQEKRVHTTFIYIYQATTRTT